MRWLVSYNHSGNGWVRYCIEYLTQLPTHGHRSFSLSERRNNFLGVDITKEPIVIKRHEIRDEEVNVETDSVVFLLRNPEDAIKESTNPYVEFDKYYKLLLFFENTRCEKMMVTYDNLFNIETIYDILHFFKLDVDEEKLNNLKNNRFFHLSESLSVYLHKRNELGTNLLGVIDNDLLENVYKYLRHG